MACSVTVLPVPVAPAMRPWRLATPAAARGPCRHSLQPAVRRSCGHATTHAEARDTRMPRSSSVNGRCSRTTDSCPRCRRSDYARGQDGNVGAATRAYNFVCSASPTFGERHENSARVRVCMHVADRRLRLGAAAGGIYSTHVRRARQGQERFLVEGGGRRVGQDHNGRPERAAQSRRDLRALGRQQGRQGLEGRVRQSAARRRRSSGRRPPPGGAPPGGAPPGGGAPR